MDRFVEPVYDPLAERASQALLRSSCWKGLKCNCPTVDGPESKRCLYSPWGKHRTVFRVALSNDAVSRKTSCWQLSFTNVGPCIPAEQERK